MKRFTGAWCVLVLVLVLAPAAPAGTMLQPVGASSSTSTDIGDLSHVIDQSGLSSGYTSGVSDFDAYIASNPTHNSNPPNWPDNVWVGFRPVGEHVDFNLGGSYPIEAMALWNLGGNAGVNIASVTLLADDNPAFSSPDALGTFNTDPNTGSMSAVLPQVITFAPTTASFVRMIIDSVVDIGTQEGGFGEVAFEVVPEPSSMLAVLGIGGLMMLRGPARTVSCSSRSGYAPGR